MKKNKNRKLLESSYKAVMNAMAAKVKSILEAELDECDDDLDECGDIDECGIDECGDDIDECNESRRVRRTGRPVNEMARAAVKRTLNPKVMANVRDAISRRHYDADWATNVKPLSKYDDIELLHRYVAALLLFNKPCPETEEDIEEIGIFKNYALKLIGEDGTGSIDDIQTLYNEQDKISSRSRRGSTRAAAGYRDNAPAPAAPAATAEPTDDFNFDEEETVVNEPVEEPETNDYPSYDEVEDNDDVELGDFDNDDDEEPVDLGDFDNDDDDEEDDETEDDGEIVEIDNMSAVTFEQFTDPKMNKSFVNFNDDAILALDGGRIGFTATVSHDGDEDAEVTFSGDTFGDALSNFQIARTASLTNVASDMYTIIANTVVSKFCKIFHRLASDEYLDDEDERIEEFSIKCFESATNVNDVVEEIEKLCTETDED